ncbi:uncharacterized protein UV8b_04309 [Ustilaginoidea virens]|uniref:DUF7728 domain-containing protein n=1 Tax=Ustilaginoidea virens TaxID=1159556 RepID=A0A063C2E6_USTVR|nr:uncharacterized protein UV8b_04309 [Ustilaginoidea virens]QUC20068.1 hypothetical protein UV8b_04309 [Ustilaginoidea virens]GAO14513.1 hypothetical protein UVI_02032240 [Ustilaginoidea virens]
MRLEPLALAAAAAAFVIVPKLSDAEEALFKALPVPDDAAAAAAAGLAAPRLVSVPCKQCAGRDGRLQLKVGVVDDARLLVNGFQVYPDAADAWHGGFLSAVVEAADREAREERLGYALTVAPEEVGRGGDGSSPVRLLRVELRVVEVGGRFVDGVPAVRVKLLKAPSGEIAVVGVETIATAGSGCRSPACFVKAVLADAFKSVKGLRPFKSCHGRLSHGLPFHGLPSHGLPSHGLARPQHEAHPNHPQAPAHDPAKAPFLSKGRPHAHHYPEHGHEWGRLITNVTQVLLPILIGITAGVGVALLAMAICGCFFRLSAAMRGDGEAGAASCPGSERRAAPTAHEEALAAEKVGLTRQDAEVAPYKDEARGDEE